MRKSVLSVISIGVLGCLLCLSIVQPAVSKDLRWAYSGDVYGLDPYAYDSTFNMNFLKHIYDTLVRWDVNLKIEPCLATSWKVVEPSVCRFYLRQDVKFQNGNSFNADDVVASIRRATHPNSPVRGTVSLVKEARKVDDYTVDILFDGAYAMLLNCLQLIHIMDYEWMAEHKCLDPIDPSKNQDSYASTHANGTGPFMIESRQPDAKTVLVVNPNWWDTPRHNLTRIVFTPIKSDATRVAALLSGEVDLIHPSPLQDADRLSHAPGVKLLEGMDLRTIWLYLNQGPVEPNDSNIKGKNPLKDLRVRKALYQAIDVEAIKSKIMRGKARIAGLWIAPQITGYDSTLDSRLLPYDPVAAQKLLAEAGYPEGFEVGFDAPNDRYVNDEKIAQAIVPMWAKIGVKARLTAQPGSVTYKKAFAGKSDIFMYGSAALPYLDGYSNLAQMLSSLRGKLGAINPGGYKNPRVDELVDKIGVETDEPKRLKMISEAYRLAKEDCIIIPLHQQGLSWAVRENVKITQSADNCPRLYTVRID